MTLVAARGRTPWGEKKKGGGRFGGDAERIKVPYPARQALTALERKSGIVH